MARQNQGAVKKIFAHRRLAKAVFAVSCMAHPLAAALEIGDPAPDFLLPGVDGKTYALKDFAKAKLLVVVSRYGR